MPKVIYNGNGLTTAGVDFEDGKVYDLSDKSAKYVLDTFPGYFSVVSGSNVKKASEPVVEAIPEPEPVVEVVPEEVTPEPAVEVVSEEVVQTPKTRIKK